MKELLMFLLRLVTSPLIGVLALGILLVMGLLVGLVLSLTGCLIAIALLFACIAVPLGAMLAYIVGAE